MYRTADIQQTMCQKACFNMQFYTSKNWVLIHSATSNNIFEKPSLIILATIAGIADYWVTIIEYNSRWMAGRTLFGWLHPEGSVDQFSSSVNPPYTKMEDHNPHLGYQYLVLICSYCSHYIYTTNTATDQLYNEILV